MSPRGFLSNLPLFVHLGLFVLHQTHAPHNDNDEPVDEFVTLLDPVRLLTLVPRNIGFSVAEAYDVVNDKLLAASKADRFIINFSQFYMMLLRMTQIVYGELFEKDSTLAFAKILQVCFVNISLCKNVRIFVHFYTFYHAYPTLGIRCRWLMLLASASVFTFTFSATRCV
jgi:hypothetical protein